ncbi:MAG: site-specific DNA-methyltransferase [Planctomycetes bacterium]|nr:site-specific DNA-methyltransferase [Planctomycetota bacterium]
MAPFEAFARAAWIRSRSVKNMPTSQLNPSTEFAVRARFNQLLDDEARLRLALASAKEHGGVQRSLARAAGIGNSIVGKLLRLRGLVATRDGRLVPLPGSGPDNPVPQLTDGRPWCCEQADALDWLRRLPDRCVSLVFFSPPYEKQRDYGTDKARAGVEWVEWLRPIVVDSARVSRGLVVVNAACPVRNWSYSPALEWLVADLTRLDGLVCGPSPYAWVKSGCDSVTGNGIPGSGGKRYQRRDWEALYTFCLPDRLPLRWADNTAFGEPPRKEGGQSSHQMRNGKRRRQAYTDPEVCNPGNVIRSPVGPHLGNPVAHENEAPMPLAVAERFVRWFVPPSGCVADPFLGSGTTIEAALRHGRTGIGCDVRSGQVEVAQQRLGMVNN